MRKVLVSGLLTLAMLGATVSGAGPAGADPTLAGRGSAFGATVTLTDTEVLPPTPEASAVAPPFPADAAETTIEVPADPLIFNATLSAAVSVHQEADLASALEVESQALAGPYNAVAVGQAESVEVLIDAVAAQVPLVEADLIRGEVVAKCTGDTVEYSANSEFVNLVVAGQDTLGTALNDLIDQLLPALDPLDPLVNVEENVVYDIPGGLAVDALVVTVAEAADPAVGLIQVRIGHAELSDVSCGAQPPPPDLPECSDFIDNDGDGLIDFPADPGCDSPEDDDERNNGGGGNLPATGTTIPTAAAAGLGAAALALFALRRRTTLA